MKINLKQDYIAQNQGRFKLHSESQEYREKDLSVQKENRGYNTYNCGSFTGKSETAANIMDKTLSSKWFGKFAQYSNEHNIASSALIALGLAGILRPAAIMALPGDKDRDDKIYAAGHAMASAIIGFIVATIITSPFDESIKKVFGNPEKYMKQPQAAKGKKPPLTILRINNMIAKLEKRVITEKTAYYYDAMLKNLTKQKNAMNTLAKNIPEWFIGVPRAILTIALIPPILKYVFGLEKKKKKNVEIKMDIPQMNFITKPIFTQFKGGVK